MYVIEDILEYEADLELTAYAGWWKPLTDALGQAPQTGLGIQVCEHNSAQESARRLISQILAVHPGICDVQGVDSETGAHVQFIVRPSDGDADG
jgi:hypothetical protein